MAENKELVIRTRVDAPGEAREVAKNCPGGARRLRAGVVDRLAQDDR